MKLVIIGGGHAAAQVATSLRQHKFDGDATLVTDEPVVPYQRPPLSKMYLSGDIGAERLPILREQAYEGANISLKLGVHANSIDRDTKTVSLACGSTLPYDKLILATGGHARRLTCKGADLAGIHYVRTMADTDAMRGEFDHAKRIVIIGGGYIGLEIAAVARKAGKAVTVLEATDRILGRVVAPEVSDFYTQLHAEEGVEIHTDKLVTSIEGTDRASAVRSADGDRYEADMVVVGIGLVPNTDLAASAHLDVLPQGIQVNAHCQTSDPDIYAVGDVAWFRHSFYGREMRIESVQNAVDQAKVAVEHMLGNDVSYDALPWFWSDQYGLKLQIAGLSQGYDTLVTRGNPAERSVAFFYLKDSKMIAADCIGRIAEFMNAKKLIASEVPVTEAQLLDERPFKEIAADLLG
ncbi:NAD(P)/FAD-dependent oxidoreductase [Kordiimonas lacus]|uniref:3-phenylpropionate/trans-cinnamate dioxygenase ferredoxin reductase subunit n=1 Tax=Kordiimonas lacus TaxID=637679 RepID=A0A1G7B207_9PROT|nr:FAD-dependent oxidoreductase [Kordiimonas lacus]SDE21148.1 3-phenylpropionate/trans-cinnamate dioxygenase ferredoxin reductase subunit [Kordiimonas lacus]